MFNIRVIKTCKLKQVWYQFTPIRMAIIRKIIISTGKNMGKFDPTCIAVGNMKWCSHFGKHSRSFSKCLASSFIWHNNLTPKRNKTVTPHKTLYTNVQCSFIPNRHKVVCLSDDEWINKIWYIHIMGCYLVTEKNKVWILATTWMNLEDIMLRESG